MINVMAKPTTTRTLGPLHLEDLEPHRFEDLIRQLLYDFRQWRQLEATGRSGSDEGFDARGFETSSTPYVGDGDELDEDQRPDNQISSTSERVWLIQCKREKSIGPLKMKRYLEGLPSISVEGTYGIIFVAACDFSLKTRDTFRAMASSLGFSEAYLWGKGEIEDQLYQPKNDHLLFAYFGFSLRIRQRTLKTELRAQIATKKKVARTLSKNNSVLVRDSSDDRYPELDKDLTKERYQRGRFRQATYIGCFHDGVHLLHRRSMAFLDYNGINWDFAETYNHGKNGWHDDPFESASDLEDRLQVVNDVWDALESAERGWFEVTVVLPYEHILAIDEDGDEVAKYPHLYVVPHHTVEEIYSYSFVDLRAIDSGRRVDPEHSTRVNRFPRNQPAEVK